MLVSHFLLSVFIALLVFAPTTLAFNISRSDNLVVYYGQNSYGGSHLADRRQWQQDLSVYCQDDVVNVIPIAFLDVFFAQGGLPSLDVANICSASSQVFKGTRLADCRVLTTDIKQCQAKGKAILLSLGGATGNNKFTNDTQASAFADTVWNLFLGGKSSNRPFGSAVLDGIDLDLEQGSQNGYTTFVNRLRYHMDKSTKKYYISAAPQCVFPDAYVGDLISSVQIDMVFIQFYNNYCGVQNYNIKGAFNFDVWDDWARNVSPNPDVKLFIGAPASATAAGVGYVGPNTLSTIAKATRANYSSFGGVMLWDMSEAYANGRYDRRIKNGIALSTSNSSNPDRSTTSCATLARSTSSSVPRATALANDTSSSMTINMTSMTASPSPSIDLSSTVASQSMTSLSANATSSASMLNSSSGSIMSMSSSAPSSLRTAIGLDASSTIPPVSVSSTLSLSLNASMTTSLIPNISMTSTTSSMPTSIASRRPEDDLSSTLTSQSSSPSSSITSSVNITTTLLPTTSSNATSVSMSSVSASASVDISRDPAATATITSITLSTHQHSKSHSHTHTRQVPADSSSAAPTNASSTSVATVTVNATSTSLVTSSIGSSTIVTAVPTNVTSTTLSTVIANSSVPATASSSASAAQSTSTNASAVRPVVSADCDGVANWKNGTIYGQGDKVLYQGHLWIANYQNATRGKGESEIGDWVDGGPCPKHNNKSKSRRRRSTKAKSARAPVAEQRRRGSSRFFRAAPA